MRQGQTTTPGTACPTLFDKCVGSLMSPTNHVTLKMQETGPAVYSPYPKRLNLHSHVHSQSRTVFSCCGLTVFVTDLKLFSPQNGNGAPPPLAPRNMANI